jgi:hypothetical protein
VVEPERVSDLVQHDGGGRRARQADGRETHVRVERDARTLISPVSTTNDSRVQAAAAVASAVVKQGRIGESDDVARRIRLLLVGELDCERLPRRAKRSRLAQRCGGGMN